MKKKRLRSLPLKEIEIQDEYWKRYIRLVREAIIPYQWEVLNDREENAEPSHCIENFRIAAGETEGDFQGAVFQDTDVYKWLEAVAYTLEVHPDEELEALADRTIDLIGRAQCQDGYLNTYFTIREPQLRWTNLKEGHELYTAGHMIEAAVAYYSATGKKQFLTIVSRFADLICQLFGPDKGQYHGYPGHQEIELALVKLYEVTGEKKYLDTAKYFIDSRGVGENYFLKEEKQSNYQPIFPEFADYDPRYSQSLLPVREQKTAEGHAVRAVYMYSGMADLSWYYKDGGLLKACEILWDDMVNRQMFITGSIGASGLLERFTVDYDLPNDCNYSETCASIGLAMFGKRMAAVTRNAKYLEAVEAALYNTILAGIALDGKSFFYVNPLEVWPDNCLERTSKEHVKPVRQKWFGVACCPPNVARTLASLGQYMYFTDDETLYINLYISNRLQTKLADNEITCEMKSDLLDSGKISVNISSPDKEKTVSIALRVPEYAEQFQVAVAGVPVDYQLENGYAIIHNLKDGQEICIDCYSEAKFVRANPKVRADIGKIALVKGPIVYCLEETDNGSNLANIFVETGKPLKTNFEPGLLGGVVSVSFEGKRLDETDWPSERLYSEKRLSFKEVPLKAIPYSSWANRESGEMTVWMKELF